ncbi:hypothetical protein DASC09_008880 [Saccharomycopsis crataegensis]|uniref:Peptidase M20 dimerisation domain-containing protein n=1 Tax=Saccharomycopsis crataegensis TaxID=43959 RepID=A0AAV5QFQ1_9ASCO|nr:hypothetical protein DASC09_008880 [Saccharomycopsis crataegensis]
MDKQELPTSVAPPGGISKPTRLTPIVTKILSASCILASLFLFFSSSKVHDFKYSTNSFPIFEFADDSLCPVSTKVVPENYDALENTINTILHDKTFRNASAAKLGGAVKIPTEVTEEWRDIYGEHFKPFGDLHQYLADTFPKVHANLKLDKVNTYGLVYTWEGSDSDLKPILLTAHQDVVPVEWATEDKWSYHPYSGYYDGEFVWGRGSSDCKNLLVGLLETMELLLEEGYQPNRTLVLGFGYDEEAMGDLGAEQIAGFLEDRYGKDSFYAVIDEGNSGFFKTEDVFLAIIATGEKGYVDSHITLRTPGGHSSVPPDHTSIGILSQLVNEIEDTPFEPILSNINPHFGYLQCFASHSNNIDKSLKSNILKAGMDSEANAAIVKFLHEDIATRYYIQTSQAIDIIQGGIKSNALPESVTIVVNSRISVDSNVEETVDKLTTNVLKVAEEFDLGVVVDEKIIRPITDNGYFNYTATAPLEAAPSTPWSGDVWDTFTGSLRFFYEDVMYSDQFDGKPVISTPGMSTGNTDTKSYWNLTSNIYRYMPGEMQDDAEMSGGIHSVNENASMEAHLNVIAFYYLYLRNIDVSTHFDKQ